jgi:hypothetical protein
VQIRVSKIYFVHQMKVGVAAMQHHPQYWLTCPKCGHQMEVGTQSGPIRAKHCDKCNLLFILTNEERSAAESVGTTDPHSFLDWP